MAGVIGFMGLGHPFSFVIFLYFRKSASTGVPGDGEKRQGACGQDNAARNGWGQVDQWKDDPVMRLLWLEHKEAINNWRFSGDSWSDGGHGFS
ncbi:MAG: hypothetical protein ABSD44_13545 [Terracidiphilus sp.]